MAPKAPKLGDRVIHHGHIHEITALPERARMRDGKPVVIKGVQFENDAYLVTMLPEDGIAWSEEDNAWFWGGRLLARNERALCEAITGAWPPAVSHEAMRSMLDSVDLAKVSMPRLCDVIVRRKADAGVAPPADGDELSEAQKATLLTYAEAVLVQCAELRALRQGG